MRSVLIIAFLLILCPLTAFSQEPQVCISQTAANQCAANTRELAATKEKVAVLEAALVEKDKTIADLKTLNDKNVQDLTAQLMKVTAEAAHEKGMRVQLEADKVFWTEIIKIAIQNTRKKCAGVSLIC